MDIRTPTRWRGFTLLEMLISLTVAAIITTSAIPALHGLIQRNRISNEISTFVTHLHYSRSEAIKRGARAVMCRSKDGESCSRTEGWQEGWIIFADYNANREFDGRDDLLQVKQGFDNGIAITSGRRRRIVYQTNGTSPGTNGTYVFCDPDYPEYARAIILSNLGRPRLARNRPSGDDLGCG